MKTTIIYFSATGETEKVAQLIGDELNVTPFDYTVRGYDISFGPDDLVFICFPVYGGRIPAPMHDRMNDVHGNGATAVLVAVYGNRAVDDALLEMSDLCKERGLRTVGGCEMVAPHSIDKRFGAGRPDETDTARLREFARAVVNRKEYRDVQMPGNRPYREYKGVPIYPTSNDRCDGCGTCGMECPTGAIDQYAPKNTDHSKCISCMRCVAVCPFGRRVVPKPMQIAASAMLLKLCRGKKTPKFYL